MAYEILRSLFSDNMTDPSVQNAFSEDQAGRHKSASAIYGAPADGEQNG